MGDKNTSEEEERKTGGDMRQCVGPNLSEKGESMGGS